MAGDYTQWNLPPWLIPTETPSDALLKGVQAGHMIAQDRNQHHALELEAQKLEYNYKIGQARNQLLAQRNALQAQQDMAKIQGEMLKNKQLSMEIDDYQLLAPTVIEWQKGNYDAQMDPRIKSGKVQVEGTGILDSMMRANGEQLRRSELSKQYVFATSGEYADPSSAAQIDSLKRFSPEWVEALQGAYSQAKQTEEDYLLKHEKDKNKITTEGQVEVATAAAGFRAEAAKVKSAQVREMAKERINDQAKFAIFDIKLKAIEANPLLTLSEESETAAVDKLMRRPEYRHPDGSPFFPEAFNPVRLQAQVDALTAREAETQAKLAKTQASARWYSGKKEEIATQTTRLQSITKQREELQAEIKAMETNLPTIKDADDYNKLPAGTWYVDPNGQKRFKK